jgi:hypothetical protein
MIMEWCQNRSKSAKTMGKFSFDQHKFPKTSAMVIKFWLSNEYAPECRFKDFIGFKNHQFCFSNYINEVFKNS